MLFSIPRRAVLSGLLLSGVVLAASPASAQVVYYWSGNGGNSSWATPANWNTGSQSGTAATVSPGNAANDGVTINQGSSSGSPVVLNSGNTTTVAAVNLGSVASGTAYLNVTGAGTILRSSGTAGANVGNGLGSSVGLSINGGGELDFNFASGNLAFASGANSTVNVTVGGGSGSTGILRNSGPTASVTRLANQTGAVANLTVNTGGSVILPGQLIVGAASGSTGAITMNGGSLSSGAIVLGNAGGTGNLTINSGTVDSSGGVSFNANSTVDILGGSLTTAAGFGVTSSGTTTIDGGTLSVGTGLTLSSGSVTTFKSGSLIGTNGGSAKLSVSGGSLSISGGSINLVGGASTIGSGSAVTQSAGSVTFAGFTVGNSGTGSYEMSGGTLSASSLTLGAGAAGNGTMRVLAGTATSAAGITIGNGTAVTGALVEIGGTGSVLVNSGNSAVIGVQIGTNGVSGSAGRVNLQGGALAPATGATNGFNLGLYTPGTLTSSLGGSSLQGYGTVTLGSTGNRTLTNGGKIIATGANLVSNTGAAASDHTLDFTGSVFTVATTTNRTAGAGWYAVNHGALAMNVSGTASATTLNWGAPTGTFSVNSLVNSGQFTFSATTAPSSVVISLLSADRTDLTALFAQSGLPSGKENVIGLWSIANNSANTLTGMTLRYDDALAAGSAPTLYYIANSSGTWTQIAATVDTTNFIVSDNVASLESGYYALMAVPEPNVTLLALGALLAFAVYHVVRKRRVV